MNQNSIKAVIFDFDDTLILTSETSARNLRYALEQFNKKNKLSLRIPTQSEIFECYSPSWRQSVIKAVPDIIDRFFLFKEFYENIRHDLEDYPLAENALESILELKEKSVDVGILTSRSNESVNARLEKLGIDKKIFECIYGIDDTFYQKPNPETFNVLKNHFRRKNIVPPEIIYVGDMPTDYYATTRARLNFLGVLSGPKREELKKIKGIHYVTSLKNVPEYVQRLNEKVTL